MPQATNLVVKKADGTTDVTYALVAAASGDKSPALFRVEGASPVIGARPTFRMESQANAAKTARIVTSRSTHPYSVSGADGRVSIVNQVIVETRVVLPNDVPDTIHVEAVAQHANLEKHAIVLASNQSGYAPT